MTADWTRATAIHIAEAVTSGDARAADVVDAHLARIASVDPEVGAYVEAFESSARALAEAVDEDRAAGRPLGPLAGVPVALKDILAYQGHELTCGSRILAGFRPPYQATVVQRLLDAGAIPIGRTNMDEFAMGSSTEHSAHGVTRNPFDRERTPGGSSGGSAAAVAARCAPLALGSDTGGSVRQPAALCGVTGMKPTYGRVSRYGMVAFASSLDHVGPFARSAEDLAALLTVIAGVDAMDSTSLDAPVPDLMAATRQSLDGLRVGIPEQYFAEGLEPDVERAVRGALAELEQMGATLQPVSLPHTRYAIPTYYLLANSEASSNLARYDGVAHGLRVSGDRDLDSMYCDTRTSGFGDETTLRILLGTFCLSRGYFDAYYLKATRVRTLVRQDFERAFETCDVLAMPTTPTTAFPLGSKLDDPLQMYLCDVLTTPANLAGVPAISIPCGLDRQRLPIGLQIAGPALAEDRLLQVAAAYQRATEHHLTEPNP